MLYSTQSQNIAPIIIPLTLKFFEISKHQDFISVSLLTELANIIYSVTKWTCKRSQKLYIILWSQTLCSETCVNIQISHIWSFIVFMYIDIKKYTFESPTFTLIFKWAIVIVSDSEDSIMRRHFIKKYNKNIDYTFVVHKSTE